MSPRRWFAAGLVAGYAAALVGGFAAVWCAIRVLSSDTDAVEIYDTPRVLP